MYFGAVNTGYVIALFLPTIGAWVYIFGGADP